MVERPKMFDAFHAYSSQQVCDATAVEECVEALEKRLTELEARIRKASDMLEDDERFGDRAHDARREVWDTLTGDVEVSDA